MNPPVMFPSFTSEAEAPNAGFESSGESDAEKMAPYKIPPVVWMVVFLIGGYLITRYALEES